MMIDVRFEIVAYLISVFEYVLKFFDFVISILESPEMVNFPGAFHMDYTIIITSFGTLR